MTNLNQMINHASKSEFKETRYEGYNVILLPVFEAEDYFHYLQIIKHIHRLVINYILY